MCFKVLRWEDSDEITWCGVFYGSRSFSALVFVTTNMFYFLTKCVVMLLACRLSEVCLHTFGMSRFSDKFKKYVDFYKPFIHIFFFIKVLVIKPNNNI